MTAGQATKIADGRSFALRTALFYAALFVTFGIHLPFMPVWLQAKGLSAGAIGWILAIGAVTRIIAIPFGTSLADRWGALHRALLVCALMTGTVHVLIGLADDAWTIGLLTGLAVVFWAPLVPLSDAYALHGLKARGQAYGPVRLWGSVAFLLANLAAGALLGWISPLNIVWLLVGAFVLASGAALLLEAETAHVSSEGRRGFSAWRVLLAKPGVRAAVIAGAMVQASHATLYGFSSIQWAGKGLSGTVIGALWSLGVICEVLLFALSPRLPAWCGPRMLLVIGGAGACLRWAIMALDPPSWGLPVLQALHAASFGATHLGAAQLISRVAEPGAVASGQGMMAAANSFMFAVATVIAGQLWPMLGPAAYWGALAFAGIGLMAALRVAQQEASPTS